MEYVVPVETLLVHFKLVMVMVIGHLKLFGTKPVSMSRSRTVESYCHANDFFDWQVEHVQAGLPVQVAEVEHDEAHSLEEYDWAATVFTEFLVKLPARPGLAMPVKPYEVTM